MASGGSNFTFNAQTGEITCHTAEKAVSNCDILLWLKDITKYIETVLLTHGQHLTKIEACVLEVLGHLQEVRGTLHSRPGRSAGGRMVCELMEQKLQERKAKRRAAASRAKGGPLPNQE